MPGGRVEPAFKIKKYRDTNGFQTSYFLSNHVCRQTSRYVGLKNRLVGSWRSNRSTTRVYHLQLLTNNQKTSYNMRDRAVLRPRAANRQTEQLSEVYGNRPPPPVTQGLDARHPANRLVVRRSRKTTTNRFHSKRRPENRSAHVVETRRSGTSPREISTTTTRCSPPR